MTLVQTRIKALIAATALGIGGTAFAADPADPAADSASVGSRSSLDEVTVVARRRTESLQDVPIPISVVSGQLLEEAGAFNVNRLKELVPTLQLYSSNPRNTAATIRGLGSSFGLTNDGIEQGVGFYVDGVYYARPASSTLDFIDVEQIEVLRGPQGTLFGKNTTAGAIVITTAKPEFTTNAVGELSYGTDSFVQAKGSVTGGFTDTLAGRLGFSVTRRDGYIDNVATGEDVNTLDNTGVRGQLLWRPNEGTEITLAGDYTEQSPNGYAQVVAGVVPTQRAAYRQFDNIIADLDYELPTLDPFDRVIDQDTPWRSDQKLGGVSLNADFAVGTGTLTSTTAWRFWEWGPSNDRDFTGLSVLALSQAPSKHEQWTQEVRWAGKFNDRLSGVVGVFGFYQDLKTDPYHTEESGDAQWRFSQSTTSPLWATPGLLDGYGIRTRSHLETVSAAVFGQLDWAITDTLRLLPGLRFNYDQKEVDFNRETYGGLQTTDPALLAIKALVYTPQAFTADTDDTNVSGQLTLAWQPTARINTFATYATSFKSVGINLGGLPTVAGQPDLSLVEVAPEDVRHYEVGIKTQPTANTTANLTLFNSDIEDYQTQVQTPQLGVNRGYLANAEKVRVRGVEFEGSAAVGEHLSFITSVAYTDGKYVSFTNAPVPLEETGAAVSFKDISGGRLPGLSKWAATLTGEASWPSNLFGREGEIYGAVDGFYRSDFSSSPSPSRYLNIEGFTLVNARVGFRTSQGLSASLWARNLLDEEYIEQLLVAAGNAGQYAAVLGDPRSWGVTVRYEF